MKDRPSPSVLAEEAVELQKQGKWKEAAEKWNRAATVSRGCGRRGRYREAAVRCLAKA